MSNKLPKILIIVGPTSSGKTSLSIKLAKKFNGEVISADSRQVYKGMDIGTGKVTKKEMQGIQHYLLDVASPKSQFSVARYIKLGNKAIKDILKKGKLPIICGGTGFYIDALIYGLQDTVAPDWELRTMLEKLTCQELSVRLKTIDPARFVSIDHNNKRRLIRALEIVLKTGRPVPKQAKISPYNTLMIGISRSRPELNTLIHKRLLIRFKQGMIKEVERLHRSGVSWQKLDDFGLEYRFISRYLRGLISKEQMIEQLEYAIIHYAKRQITWFKRDQRTIWHTELNILEKIVKKWLFDK